MNMGPGQMSRKATARSSLFSKSTVCVGLAFLLVLAFLLASYSDLPRSGLASVTSGLSSYQQNSKSSPEELNDALALQWKNHPIDKLVQQADEQFTQHQKTTLGVGEAATAYRQRRGRHPPPGFDRWVEFAEERDAVMVESFFDTMYNSIAPFWGVAAAYMREFPASWPFTISIRNGNATRWTDESDQGFEDWMALYLDAINELPLKHIPDIDLAFNADDEPHMFVPWETVQRLREKGNSRKHTDPSTPAKPILNSFSKYKPLPLNRPRPEDGFHFDMYPENVPMWTFAREACSPDTPARGELLDLDYSTIPEFPSAFPGHMPEGYVADWSAAKSACINPDIRGLHGSFIHPQAYSINANGGAVNYSDTKRHIIKDMVPILSGSRMHDVNQEILIPPGIHWKLDDPEFSFNENSRTPFDRKNDLVMWRGSASGGVNDAYDWIRFHRHRFVAMQNGSLVAASQQASQDGTYLDADIPRNFPLPNANLYALAVMKEPNRAEALGDWIKQSAHAAFTHIRCWPLSEWFDQDPSVCSYNDRYYRVEKSRPASDFYYYKYLPDIDGASYSGRFRAFLQSNSLPMKASVYDEWHDDRLIPWKHFVPMDNTFTDWWGLLQYFLGYANIVEGHDDVAQDIAESGRKWAAKVIRNEDMVIYLYRLVLELARLSDDRRNQMGYVEDLEG